MTMCRYAANSAANKINEYYNPTPCELTTSKTTVAFERARNQAITALESALAGVGEISEEEFFSLKYAGKLGPLWGNNQ